MLQIVQLPLSSCNRLRSCTPLQLATTLQERPSGNAKLRGHRKTESVPDTCQGRQESRSCLPRRSWAPVCHDLGSSCWELRCEASGQRTTSSCDWNDSRQDKRDVKDPEGCVIAVRRHVEAFNEALDLCICDVGTVQKHLPL